MKTLKTLVLKTATVTGVKLAAPADRIGLGLRVAVSDGQPVPGAIPNAPQSGTRTGPVTAGCPRCRCRECGGRAMTPCPWPVRPDVSLVFRLSGSRRFPPPGLRAGEDDADGGEWQNPRAVDSPTPAGPTFPAISITTTDSAATANRPTGSVINGSPHGSREFGGDSRKVR